MREGRNLYACLRGHDAVDVRGVRDDGGQAAGQRLQHGVGQPLPQRRQHRHVGGLIERHHVRHRPEMGDPLVNTLQLEPGTQQRAVDPIVAPPGQQEAHIRRQLPAPAHHAQRQRHPELVLLQADAAGNQQRDVARRQAPARARLSAFLGRGWPEPIEVDEVMDDLHLLGGHARDGDQLPPHPLGVGEHARRPPGEAALGQQVERMQLAVARGGDHDRHRHARGRHPPPEVRGVAPGVQDRRSLAAQDLAQTAEPAPAHALNAEHVARLPGQEILRVVNRLVEHAHHRLEPVRQAADQLQQLPLGTPLLQVGGQVENLVAAGHERGRRTLTDRPAGLKLAPVGADGEITAGRPPLPRCRKAITSRC